jgi:hypothetical protein
MPALSPLYALSALDQRSVDQLTVTPEIVRSDVVAQAHSRRTLR